MGFTNGVMRFLRTVFFASVWSIVAATASPGAELKPTIIVTADTAEFSIPVSRQESWRWYREETSDNSLEYRWEVSVMGRDGEYQCGFSLFKYPGRKEETGSLKALLIAGQASLWKADPDGGASMLRDVNVSATAGDGFVLVRLSDPASVRLLFGNRPTTAKVKTRTPDSDDTSCTVSIRYRE